MTDETLQRRADAGIRTLHTAEDADAVREAIETVYDGWYADAARVDWESFYDRLETHGAFMPEYGNAADRRVRAIVKQIRSESA